MKPTYTVFLILIFTLSFFDTLQGQSKPPPVHTNYLKGTITVNGVPRTYLLYIPKTYSSTTKSPLVINFHGYGSNAQEQMAYGDFRPEAEAHNFLIIHPQGELLNGKTHWNVGGWTLNSTTDDVKFTVALIDSLSAKYTIDSKKIYATGMSNGGYMSFKLAYELSTKIAAIASVTGSMTPQTFSACQPQRAIPILQIHGVSDPTVPYLGANWSTPISKVLSFWVNHNKTSTTPLKNTIPNTNVDDQSTAERWEYENNINHIKVIHYKITGGKHTWPGALFKSPGTNQDFNASKVIWNFFSSYDLDGYIQK
ncbi:prolyl oligopeptidase family serine peptidase [Flavobacteriaceae bacterium F08102]|nr:prolyl oligopeptidase family serine peptidase [Flavobacteriaceae bacterium F08102]